MTILGRLISFFPAAFLLGVLSLGVTWVRHPSLLLSLAIPLVIYLFPPLVFRIHDFFFPLEAGVTRFSESKYSPWWGSYQIQSVYIALPALEGVLRLIPGLYSAWLRLWGAQVGKGVYWTPRLEILDRSLLNIGDRVIFGYRVCCISHVITQKADGTQLLYVKPIKIGAGALLGAAVQIGPGCTIAPKARVDVMTVLKVNEKYPTS